jgi:hypothetical protein
MPPPLEISRAPDLARHRMMVRLLAERVASRRSRSPVLWTVTERQMALDGSGYRVLAEQGRTSTNFSLRSGYPHTITHCLYTNPASQAKL